jgi:hypothetical protein
MDSPGSAAINAKKGQPSPTKKEFPTKMLLQQYRKAEFLPFVEPTEWTSPSGSSR